MAEITLTLELDVQENALGELLEALEGARMAGDDTVRLAARALGKYDLSIDASRLTVEVEPPVPPEEVEIPPIPEEPKKAKKGGRKAKRAKKKGLTREESALMEEMYEAEAKMEAAPDTQKEEEKAEKPAREKKGKHGKSAHKGKKKA